MQHFSIRKLSIGAASVLIGISFLGVKASTVKADSLQNASAAELTKPKAANEAIKQDTSSNIEQEPTSDIKKDTSSNIEQDTGSNIKQETASKADTKQITNDHPNTAQTSAQPVTPKPNSNQQNTANLEAKPQVPGKAKLQTNSVITPNKAGQSKVRVTNLMAIAGKKLSPNLLAESKVVTPAKDTNGGFDEATWGTLDINAWKGSVQGDYYQLTSYTGDANHVIVPNEADFEKAGISTSGKQVGVTSDLMKSIRSIYNDDFFFGSNVKGQTVAFSKTDNKQIKALNSDWSDTWSNQDQENMMKITQFDGSSLDVSSVKNMRSMFEDVPNMDLSSLSNWDVSNVTDMRGMFDKVYVHDLSPLAKWDVSKVTDMNSMFSLGYISDLSPLAKWDVSNVTDMGAMFSYCWQIGDLSPLTNWKVDKVTNMGQMFAQSQISDLSPLANWKVDNVRNMYGMFKSNQIGDLSPLANWNVNNVIDMSYMFDDNSGSKTKTATAKRIIDFVYPAGYTGKKQDSVTQTVNVPQKVSVTLTTKESKPSNNILDWVTTAESPEDTATVYFQDYTVPEIKGLLEPDKLSIAGQQIAITNPNKAVISGLPADIAVPMYTTVIYKLVDSNTNDAYALDPKNGLHEHANVNDNGGYDADYWGNINVDNWNYTVNGDTITINSLKDGISTGANDAVIVPNLDDFKLAGKDGGAKTVYISNSALGKTAKHKYYGLSKTNGNKFATDSTLNNAFNSSNLTHADLNNLNTSNVTDMSYMFYNASGLTNLDVSKWDTGNITDMSYMFYCASGLKSLDVSKWDTGKVTDMSWMFNSASSLTDLDVSNWKTGNVTNMSFMFRDTYGLTSLDVSKWDTGKVTDMSWMFSDTSRLTSLDVSKWNTSNVTDMSGMFYGASKLTSPDVSNWDTRKVTDMRWMFNGASSLTSLDVSKWDTGKVTDMSNMFNGASKLTSLDVSKWDTGKVTNMSWMFNGASSLTSLDVSNWDTGKVTNMSYMFNNASSLTSLDVSKWNTGNVTNMRWMFSNTNTLALIVNGDKFADYLVNHDSFAESNVDSDIKSVTTDNPKLLKLLTNDSQHNSAIRTIALMLPVGYNPDLVKYHLIKVGNTYQIKQSADYDKSYVQGTVLINDTYGIAYHHIDTTKLYKLSDTWQPNYDKLVLAHKNNDGTVSFDAVQLPKVPGYKAVIRYESPKVAEAINPRAMLFRVSYIAIPKKPIEPDAKPDEPTAITPNKPTAITPIESTAKLDKPTAKLDKPTAKLDKPTAKPDEPDVTQSKSDVQDHLSDHNTQTPVTVADDAVVSQNVDPVDLEWKIDTKMGFDNGKRQAVAFEVSNSDYSLNLPYVNNSKLHLIKQYTTKDAVSFAYVGQNSEYVFNIKFVNGHYLLTTYKIKSGKLVKLTDYNFVKSSKMIEVILDWLH